MPNVQYRTPDDGQRGCPKHVEFYNRINWIISASGLLFKKKSLTMHGNMNVKLVVVHVIKNFSSFSEVAACGCILSCIIGTVLLIAIAAV